MADATCATCRHWKQIPDAIEPAFLGVQAAFIGRCLDQHELRRADGGCIHHEPKGEER